MHVKSKMFVHFKTKTGLIGFFGLLTCITNDNLIFAILKKSFNQMHMTDNNL